MSRNPVGVHLCGTVPFDSSAQTCEIIGIRLGDRLYRVPDGETNEGRQNWLACQMPLFMGENAELLSPYLGGFTGEVKEKELHEYEAILDKIPAKYDIWTTESYKGFKAAKDAGNLPKHIKFQVSLPTPLAVVTLLVHPGHQRLVEKAYTRKLRECVDRLQDAVPHEDLAIQWDCAVEPAILENVPGYDNDMFVPHFQKAPDKDKEVMDRLRELERWVQPNVELGFHLCYGDINHVHYKQPDDTGVLAGMIEVLLTNSYRKIDFIHIPVPKNRSDAAYLEPLKKKVSGLMVEQGTTLFLGLVHESDETGSQAKIETAREVFKDEPDLEWGIGTECGMGRTPKDQVDRILDISRSLSATV